MEILWSWRNDEGIIAKRTEKRGEGSTEWTDAYL